MDSRGDKDALASNNFPSGSSPHEMQYQHYHADDEHDMDQARADVKR